MVNQWKRLFYIAFTQKKKILNKYRNIRKNKHCGKIIQGGEGAINAYTIMPPCPSVAKKGTVIKCATWKPQKAL